MSDHHDVPRQALVLGLPDHGAVVLLANLGNKSVYAPDDVFGALAARASVAPYVPAPLTLFGTQLPNFRGRHAFVFAIVPFRDARVDRDTSVGLVLRRRR